MIMIFEDQFEMPLGFESLNDFRRWALSDEYPERGRVDFVLGRIEIDMAAEELFTHGSPKVEIAATLRLRIKRMELGHLFVDDTRVSNVAAELSSEPDVVFVSGRSLDSGSVRLIPKARTGGGKFIEIEGSPDMIAEIVSDSSVSKDKKRLPKAYFKARVPEYWLVDARRGELMFRIHQFGKRGYRLAPSDSERYQFSEAFGCWFRLDRFRDRRGNWEYDLLSKERPHH
jgi:Uma2 family endonuclease